MRDILENEAIFEAYARIDCCYYCLDVMYDLLGNKRLAIEKMIDGTTGYSKSHLKETIETVISLMEQVIKDKKFIKANYSKDEKILKQIKKIKK